MSSMDPTTQSSPISESTENVAVTNKARGRRTKKCYWEQKETELLIEALQDIASDPSWKTDGGFRSNYLCEVQRMILIKMPTFSKLVSPHIESKVKWLKAKFHVINDMLTYSACQWNDVEKKVACDKDWYDGYCKTHKEAKGMWDFKFPFFKELELVYGKDRATGGVVEGFGDAIHNMEAERNVETGVVDMKSKVVEDHVTKRSTKRKKALIVVETDIEKNQLVKPNEMEVGSSKNKPRKGVSRSSPHPLYDSLRFLSNSQKNTLVDMGFGFLIGMNIHSVPSILSSYLVRNFNQSLMRIELRNDSIEITPELVKEVLGIPLGGQGLVKISNDELKVRWKAQFNKRPTPKIVAEMIKKTDETGIMFKLNFFVVFYNAMCASQEDGRANTDILDYLSEDVEIRNLDWCTFVFNCLKHTRKPKIYFCGSVTLLMLIYLNWTKCDEVNVMRSRPAITSWTSDLMKDREDFEIENGGFGNLEVLPLDDEVFKEQSSQKDLQFVEDKIEANLFILSNEKNKLQKFITDSILMFPDNIKLKGLKGMFDDLFCREKVHDPEFSHDLNVIGTIAADANREDQGIAADVDDPTVKERNHVDPECSHDLNVIIGTIAADVNREHQGIAADVEDPTVKIRNHDDQDVEAMEILDYIEIPGWPTKRGRDNEIEDVEALKRKCTGQRNAIVAETASANQSQILSAAQLSQALQTAEPSQANVAQASPTTKTSQTSILHASPTYKDDKENCEKDWNMDGLKSMLGL